MDMKKNSKRKVLSGLLFATTLLSIGVTAGGAVHFLDGEIVAAETVNNPVADTTSKRSLTIWKYAVTDNSELGTPGDGTATNPEKDVIPGIKFKVERVKNVSGKASLTDPKKQVLGTDYTIDSTFAAQTITTDSNGQAVLDLGTGKANDGIYLVTELADDRTGSDLAATNGKKVETPAAPFFVYVPQTSRTDLSSLIYDVQVEPKNILEDLIEPVKMINDEKGDSVRAGEDFEWEMTTNVPAGLWQVASQDGTLDILDANGNVVDTVDMVKGQPIIYRDASGVLEPNFSMVDTLDKQLTYLKDSAKMQVRKDDASEWVDLAAADYTVAFDEASNTLTTTLTETGLQKVGTAANGYTQIRTILETHVAENWNGILENTFTEHHQIPGQKPKTTTPPPTTNPKYYTGGFDLNKTAEDTKAALAGAEFKIALTESDANNKIFLANDGKSYAEDATLPAGVSYLTSTSDKDGKAQFNGLALDWVDANNNNYVEENEVSRDYWVVETKAPEGYELLKEAQKVTVTLTTENDGNVELDVVDKPKTKLPFTGGQGTTMLVAIALGAIVIGAAVVVIDKKRQKV